ncbi:MAG: YbjQ family protein [Caldisericaceae bacterium]|nr:YbjQ family protein [Caldisericaceae bacterium]
MIITTLDYVPGKEVKEVLGVAMGNIVRAKNIGQDILAGLRNIAGGEVKEYTQLLKEAREEAIRRMEKYAEEMGADAVLNVRFVTSSVMQGAAELLAYGTAVELE